MFTAYLCYLIIHCISRATNRNLHLYVVVHFTHSELACPFTGLISEMYTVAVLLNLHQNKSRSDTPLQEVS